MYQSPEELRRENARLRSARETEIEIMNKMAEEHKKITMERDRLKKALTAVVSANDQTSFAKAVGRAKAMLTVKP